jgi:hypothetical protein
VFAFAALLAASAIVSENKSFVHLESSAKSVRAGEQFSIDVYVTAHVPVNAVDLTLDFPKEQISIVGIDKGQSVITLWTEEPSVKGNSVVMRGGTFRKGFIGNHLIATINARATQTGVAEFSVGTESAVGVKGDVAILLVTDIDGDGVVSLVDISRFMGAWSTGGTVYDFNGDGAMTFRDFGIILSDSFLH